MSDRFYRGTLSVLDHWIPITVFAAFMQNLRSALQKHLKGRLSTGGASYVRFFYACPVALIYLWAVHGFGGYPLPAANALVLPYCLHGGPIQITFPFLLVYLLPFRNLALGTTYPKTQIIHLVLLDLFLLVDTTTPAAPSALPPGMFVT